MFNYTLGARSPDQPRLQTSTQHDSIDQGNSPRATNGVQAILRRPWVSQSIDSLQTTVLRLGSVVVNLMFGMVAARLLGAESFGTYASWMAITGFLSVAVSVGLPSLITREVASARGSGVTDALTPLAQFGAVVLVVGFVAVLASLAAPSRGLTVVLATTLSFSLVTLLAGAACGHERVVFANWMNVIVRPLVALATLVLLAQFVPPTYETALLTQLIGAVVASLLLLLAWKPYDIWAGMRDALTSRWWSPRHLTVARMGVVFAVSQLLINATTQLDVLILSALAAPEDVAHDYAAARAALVVSFFCGANAAMAEPKLARLYAAGQMDEFTSVIRTTGLIGAAMAIASSAAALAIAPYYFAFYGPSFAAGLPCLVLLVIGLIGWSLFGPAQVALRATGREKNVVYATAIALVVNCIVSVTLIPFVGILGAAIGTTAQFLVYGALMAYMLYSSRGLRPDLFHRAILQPLSGGAPVAVGQDSKP